MWITIAIPSTTPRHVTSLRRRAEPEPFLLGALAIRYDERQVMALTATDFELLRVLAVNAGRVVRYHSLLRQAWGGRAQGSGDPKRVRAVVKTVRRKLGGDAARPAYILNERGVGYRMPAPGGP